MSKDVRRALQIAKHPLTQDVYHGTQAVFDRFRDSSKDRGEYTPSLMLGTHVARDPAISSNEYFTDRSGEQGGHVMPLKTYPDDKFFEIPQTKPNGTLEEDDKAVEQAIKLHAFKKHPEMLAHSLMMYHGLPVEKAAAAAHKLVAGGTYTSPGGETLNSLQALVNHWTLSPDYASPAARKQAVKSFRDHLIKQGYAGVKYQNTAPDETRDAKDKTNYIVFNKPTSEGYYPLRGRFAAFNPEDKASPDLMKSSGGEVEARRGRGAAMGFDMDTPLYHGTNKDIQAFEPRRASRWESMALKGTHLADNPEFANQYAQGKGANVMPVRARGKFLDAGKLVYEGSPEHEILTQLVKQRPNLRVFWDKDHEGKRVAPPLVSYLDAVPPAAAERIVKAAGYDGVRYPARYGDPSGRVSARTNATLVFDPKNIRSQFAAYDPEHSDSADLMKAEGGAVDNQEITSADTSIKQIPALFKSNVFEKRPGQRNLDIGGGKFDLGTQHLAEHHGVESHVYDPFNRSEEHNASVLRKFARKKADSVTAANVLNVIQHPHHRKAVIQQAHDNLHPTGKAYFGIYEGNGSGKGAVTSKGWQNNRKAEGYMDEVREVFPHVERRGNIIVAHKRAPRAHGGATKEARQALMLAHGGVPPFKLHSGAAKLIGQKGQLKATPQQYAAMPGIKPDELKHANFDKLGTKALPREEVIKHLEANAVPIKETALRKNPAKPSWEQTHFANEPKFEQYTLPGGENYREVLLHLPPAAHVPSPELSNARERAEAATRAFDDALADQLSGAPRLSDEAYRRASSEADAARIALARLEREDKRAAANPEGTYKSSHWDQPNVVAHLRMSDRKGPNGEKILHVEEAQSDWGQEGRERGFKGQKSWNPDNIEKVVLPRMGDEPVWAYRHPETGHHIYPANSPAEVEEMLSDNESDKPPQGPYVDNTQKWTDLALKRILHEAAHGGYDKIAFTPGAEQNKRYSLAKHIKHLHAMRTDDPQVPTNKPYTVWGVNHDDDVVYRKEHSEDELSGVVGKELAKKIVERTSSAPNKVQEFKDADLEIGGSGMRGYYDNILPKRLQALAQQHDPKAKVQLKSYRLPPKKKLQGYDTEPGDVLEHMGVPPLDWSVRWPAMSDDEKAQAHAAYENSGPVLHSLDVTPQMRDSIKQNGFSQFKRGGAVDENEGPIADWHWRPLDEVKDELQLHEIPSHVHKFGEFMDETARRASMHGLTPRDLIKAYAITRASIGRRALPVETLRQTFPELPEGVEGRVRPEGAMGHWLHTKMGQRYLDAAEAGRVDEEAIAHAQNAMRRFGKVETEPTALRWAAKNLPGKEGRVSELIARAHRGQSSSDEWRSEMRMPGVAASKAGFLASMLGRGDQPTLDARQIILHTGRPTKEAAPILGRKGAANAAVDRLAARQTALGFKHDKSMSPFYQHLAHHAIWDKTAGEETTHDDLMQALRGAKNGGRQGFSTGGKSDERRPAHYLVRAMLELFPHGFKDVPEPELRRMLRNPHTDVSPDTIKAVLHARPATHGLLHRASAVTGHDPEKLMQHLLPSGPGEPGRQGITSLRRPDLIERAMATIAPNAAIEVKRPKVLTPEDLVKMRAVTVAGMSDRTGAGYDVLGADKVDFGEPISALGGTDYNMLPHARKNKLAWASARTPITTLGNAARDKLKEVKEKYGVDAQPLLTTKMMSLQALDQTHMMMRAATHLLRNAPVTDADAEEFNQFVRNLRPSAKKGVPQPPYMPDFPGIKDEKLYDYLMKQKMPNRTALIKAMDIGGWNKKGIPNPTAIRMAFTKPELISAPEGTPGSMFATMDPESPHHTVDSAHGSYPVGVKGVNVGRFDRAVPKEAFNQEYFDDPAIQAKIAKGKTANVMSGYIKSPVTQYHDQQWLDRIMPIYEKAPPFRKTGGSVVDRALALTKKVTRG